MDQTPQDPKPPAPSPTSTPVTIQPSSSFIAETKQYPQTPPVPVSATSSTPPPAPAAVQPAPFVEQAKSLPLALTRKPKHTALIVAVIVGLVLIAGSYLATHHAATASKKPSTATKQTSNTTNSTSSEPGVSQEQVQSEENPINSNAQVKSEVNYCTSSPLTC